MRVPLSWLKEYVDVEDTPKGLAERLTFCGIEVEAIEPFGADYTGMVVAEVRSVERHPQADRLTVCRVFDGQAEVQVVCGAPNVRAGGRYPFAPMGVTLPGGLKIKRAKLRGVESCGMLCAEDELGLSEDHGGLMELDVSLAAGTPLAEVLGGPDTVLDLEITPNRPDCLGLIGIAREVAALYRLPLKRPDLTLRESGPGVETSIAVDVRDSTLCPRYTARAIRNIRMGPSPLWMQRRLAAAGIRPISNVVDITNYVMLETGQPLHAFDHALLRGGRMVIRAAAPGERMHTLDGQDRTLSPSMLLIADAERAVAIAGVMGGAGSEVLPTTTEVLLESAAFLRSSVRATSKQLGLATESSYRFARGVDMDGVEAASRRAARLLAELASGEIAPGVVDVYPTPPTPRPIRIAPETMGAQLGYPISALEIVTYLKSLEIPALELASGEVEALPPGFRGDLTMPEDLTEECARLRGLDAIPVHAPHARVVEGAEDRTARARRLLHETLVALGLTEAMNYSLTSASTLDRFGTADSASRIRLPHPLSEDQSILRPSLLPQLVETLGRNRAHQTAEAAMFEIGRVFHLASGGGTAESTRAALAMMGPAGRDPLRKRAAYDAEEALSWMRGILDALARRMRTAAFDTVPAAHSAFEPGTARELRVDGAAAGIMGIVKPALAAEWRIFEPVVAAELELAPWISRAFAVPAPVPPAAFPSSSRDIAFIVPSQVQHEEIERVIRNAVSGPELERVELFDIFTGTHIGAGKKSMAYALTYRSTSRTLTVEDVSRLHDGVVRALKDSVGAEVRDA